jgi:hypothetical protein
MVRLHTHPRSILAKKKKKPDLKLPILTKNASSFPKVAYSHLEKMGVL